jgi:hypothetical protein
MPNVQFEFLTFAPVVPSKLCSGRDEYGVQFPTAKRLVAPPSTRKVHLGGSCFAHIDVKTAYAPIGIILRRSYKRGLGSHFSKRLRSTPSLGTISGRRLKNGSTNSELVRRWREQLFRMIERESGIAPSLASDSSKLDASVRGVVEAMKEVKIRNASQHSAATGLAPIEGFEDAISDQNYRAFLRDVGSLVATHGKCVVAYSNGERVALGKDRPEVLSILSQQKPKGEILIQEVPERVIKFRRPFRVRK